MEIKNFRFKTRKNNVYSLVKSRELRRIEELINVDRGAFELATNYFHHYSNNDDPLNSVENYLQDEMEILEIELDVSFNSGWVSELKKYLSYIHMSLGRSDFKKIRNSYIEFIVLKWKNLFGRDSNVYIEPKIYHKRKLLFEKKTFCNSVCDIVHVDKKQKIMEMYECKTTMKMFIYHIGQDENSVTDPNKKKDTARAKRKQQYMSSFFNLLSRNVDIKKVEVAYITLTNSEDLPFSEIEEIPIITREAFSENYFNIFPKK